MVKLNSNTRNQITRNLRFIHDYWFIIPSIDSEKVANQSDSGFLSFKNITYRKSYQIAKKIKGYSFIREHINGGTQYLSDYLIKNFNEFNDAQELLNWLVENSKIILRLDSQKESIHKNSKYNEIRHLISE